MSNPGDEAVTKQNNDGWGAWHPNVGYDPESVDRDKRETDKVTRGNCAYSKLWETRPVCLVSPEEKSRIITPELLKWIENVREYFKHCGDECEKQKLKNLEDIFPEVKP